MPRFLAPLLLLCLTFNAHADSYITRLLNKPVPGGVAVVDLGAAAQAPKASYQGKPVLVVKEQNNWLAIVGVPLTVKPGAQADQQWRAQPWFHRRQQEIPGAANHPEEHPTGQSRPGQPQAHRA